MIAEATKEVPPEQRMIVIGGDTGKTGEDPGLMTPGEVDQYTSEAMRPDETPDTMKLGDLDIAIKFHPMAVEKIIVKLLAPLLLKVAELPERVEINGYDADGRPVGFTPVPQVDWLKARLAMSDDVFDTLPKAVSLISGGLLTPEEIENRFSILELMPIAVAQMKKYGIQDKLGKL